MASEAATEHHGGIPLVPGACYLVEERKPDLAYRLFDALRKRKPVPGLVVTRQYPDRVKRERDLKDARIVWLSHTPGTDYQNPTALGALAKSIAKFVEDAGGEGVVLLDGLEYLVVNNGFLQTLMFIEHVNEFVMQKRGYVLLPVNPDALDEKELALLSRNLETVEGEAVRIDLERSEVAKLLDAY